MRRIALALIALLAFVVLAPQSTAAQTTNLISVVHASPDAPAVDVFINGEVVAANVTFFTASGYLPLADGTYQVAISPAGKGTDYSVIVGDLEVSGGFTGTLVALDTLANIRAVLYEDDLSPVADGLARVNVYHLAPDAPAVDVKLAGTDATVFAGLAFTDAAFGDVDAGTYRFDITPAGSPAVVFTTPELRFENGWIYSLFATGELGKGGFWVQSTVDQIPEYSTMSKSLNAVGTFTLR
jgi:hypothetical protein